MTGRVDFARASMIVPEEVSAYPNFLGV